MSELSPEMLQAIYGLIVATLTKGAAEIYARWRFGQDLKRELHEINLKLKPLAEQCDSNAKELAAVGVRIGVLEDMGGPVLR